jgi:Spy/CpxP family protein refolding chaperone
MHMMKPWLFAVAVVAGGVGTVAALPRGEGGAARGGRFAHVKEQLGLSERQEARFREIRESRQRDSIRRRADVQVARLDLRRLLESPTLDRKAVDAKVKEISDLHAAGFRARVDTMLEMREVLTPEQLKKWQDLRPERGRPGRGHRGPRGRGMGMGNGPADPDSPAGPGPEER